jgi:anti-anti-sigma factor
LDDPQDVTVERPHAGTAVVAFRGEHDLADRDAIEALLRSLVEEGGVVVDFSEARFVDSTMPKVLLSAEAVARKRGHVLAMQLGTEAVVSRAFELSGALEQIEAFDSRDEALARLRRER